MKAILLAMSALLMLALTGTIQAHAQTPIGQQPQACPYPAGSPYACPIPPQQPFVPQSQYVPQPQFVPQAQAPPQVVTQPSGGITLQNLTVALTAALDPINKHLTVIDSQIVNITKK